MPKINRPGWVPKYRQHKSSGQAYVSLAGRDVFLGRHGSEQSRAEYDRVVAEWLASARAGVSVPKHADRAEPATVAELILAFWRYAEPIYPAQSLWTARSAFRHLRVLYGHTPIADFSPLGLKAIQKRLADELVPSPKKPPGDEVVPPAPPHTPKRRYCRKTINDYTARIRHLFKWGVGEGLVPAPVWQALMAVPGLRYGRTTARERPIPSGPLPTPTSRPFSLTSRP